MSIYTELQSVTKEIMSEFSQGAVQLVKITGGAGPIDNPGASTETLHTLDASAVGVSSQLVRDGLAVETDLMVTSSVVDGVTPTETDFIDIDGIRHKIVKDMSTPAAGVKVAWKFIVRKGV